MSNTKRSRPKRSQRLSPQWARRPKPTQRAKNGQSDPGVQKKKEPRQTQTKRSVVLGSASCPFEDAAWGTNCDTLVSQPNRWQVTMRLMQQIAETTRITTANTKNAIIESSIRTCSFAASKNGCQAWCPGPTPGTRSDSAFPNSNRG